MGTVELKSNLYKILERIDNEQLLRAIYDFLKQREGAKEGQIWASLTDEQKNEVTCPTRNGDENNLIAWKDVKKKLL